MFFLTRLLKCFKATFSNSNLSSEVQFYLSKKKRSRPKRRRKRKNILKVRKIKIFISFESYWISRSKGAILAPKSQPHHPKKKLDLDFHLCFLETITGVPRSTVVHDLRPTLKQLLYLGPFHRTVLHCSTQEKTSIIGY